jgi:hypothetical protein
MHCYDSKTACPGKDLVFLDECAALNNPKFEVKKFVMD